MGLLKPPIAANSGSICGAFFSQRDGYRVEKTYMQGIKITAQPTKHHQRHRRVTGGHGHTCKEQPVSHPSFPRPQHQEYAWGACLQPTRHLGLQSWVNLRISEQVEQETHHCLSVSLQIHPNRARRQSTGSRIRVFQWPCQWCPLLPSQPQPCPCPRPRGGARG